MIKNFFLPQFIFKGFFKLLFNVFSKDLKSVMFGFFFFLQQDEKYASDRLQQISP